MRVSGDVVGLFVLLTFVGVFFFALTTSIKAREDRKKHLKALEGLNSSDPQERDSAIKAIFESNISSSISTGRSSHSSGFASSPMDFSNPTHSYMNNNAWSSPSPSIGTSSGIGIGIGIGV